MSDPDFAKADLAASPKQGRQQNLSSSRYTKIAEGLDDIDTSQDTILFKTHSIHALIDSRKEHTFQVTLTVAMARFASSAATAEAAFPLARFYHDIEIKHLPQLSFKSIDLELKNDLFEFVLLNSENSLNELAAVRWCGVVINWENNAPSIFGATTRQIAALKILESSVVLKRSDFLSPVLEPQYHRENYHKSTTPVPPKYSPHKHHPGTSDPELTIFSWCHVCTKLVLPEDIEEEPLEDKSNHTPARSTYMLEISSEHEKVQDSSAGMLDPTLSINLDVVRLPPLIPLIWLELISGMKYANDAFEVERQVVGLPMYSAPLTFRLCPEKITITVKRGKLHVLANEDKFLTFTVGWLSIPLFLVEKPKSNPNHPANGVGQAVDNDIASDWFDWYIQDGKCHSFCLEDDSVLTQKDENENIKHSKLIKSNERTGYPACPLFKLNCPMAKLENCTEKYSIPATIHLDGVDVVYVHRFSLDFVHVFRDFRSRLAGELADLLQQKHTIDQARRATLKRSRLAQQSQQLPVFPANPVVETIFPCTVITTNFSIRNLQIFIPESSTSRSALSLFCPNLAFKIPLLFMADKALARAIINSRWGGHENEQLQLSVIDRLIEERKEALFVAGLSWYCALTLIGKENFKENAKAGSKNKPSLTVTIQNISMNKEGNDRNELVKPILEIYPDVKISINTNMELFQDTLESGAEEWVKLRQLEVSIEEVIICAFSLLLLSSYLVLSLFLCFFLVCPAFSFIVCHSTLSPHLPSFFLSISLLLYLCYKRSYLHLREILRRTFIAFNIALVLSPVCGLQTFFHARTPRRT
jgi:hypothetical protein